MFNAMPKAFNDKGFLKKFWVLGVFFWDIPEVYPEDRFGCPEV